MRVSYITLNCEQFSTRQNCIIYTDGDLPVLHLSWASGNAKLSVSVSARGEKRTEDGSTLSRVSTNWNTTTPLPWPTYSGRGYCGGASCLARPVAVGQYAGTFAPSGTAVGTTPTNLAKVSASYVLYVQCKVCVYRCVLTYCSTVVVSFYRLKDLKTSALREHQGQDTRRKVRP